jgi:hypothetical protein
MKIEDVLEWKRRKLEILKANPNDNEHLIESESIIISALEAYADHDRLQKAFALACRLLEDSYCPADVYQDVNVEDCPENCGEPDCEERAWRCWQKKLLEIVDAEPVCRVCGCTQNNACPGGCSWVEPDLCSSCAEENESGGENDGRKL